MEGPSMSRHPEWFPTFSEQFMDTSDLDTYFWEDLKAICIVIAGIFMLFILVAWIILRFDWVSSSARIERLRIDAQHVNSKMAEDVAGQVTSANQSIAEMQRWRKTVFKFFIPSGWDKLEPIPMPKVEP